MVLLRAWVHLKPLSMSLSQTRGRRWPWSWNPVSSPPKLSKSHRRASGWFEGVWVAHPLRTARICRRRSYYQVVSGEAGAEGESPAGAAEEGSSW